MKRSAVLLALIAAIVAAAYLESRAQAPAPAPDPADLAAGMRLYQQKGDCKACHGWAADGVKSDSQMPDGPSLRDKKYTRQLLILTIKCGRPNTQMPAFDKFAYTDGRCFMMTAADLEEISHAHARSAGHAAAARDRADRRFPVGKGRRPGADGPGQVRRFWGSDVAVCKELKK